MPTPTPSSERRGPLGAVLLLLGRLVGRRARLPPEAPPPDAAAAGLEAQLLTRRGSEPTAITVLRLGRTLRVRGPHELAPEEHVDVLVGRGGSVMRLRCRVVGARGGDEYELAVEG